MWEQEIALTPVNLHTMPRFPPPVAFLCGENTFGQKIKGLVCEIEDPGDHPPIRAELTVWHAQQGVRVAEASHVGCSVHTQSFTLIRFTSVGGAKAKEVTTDCTPYWTLGSSVVLGSSP